MQIIVYDMRYDVLGQMYRVELIAELESWLKNSARTPIYQCELL